jgi:hypothetical protein
MAKKKKSKKQAKADKQQAPAPAFGNISDEQQRDYEREIRLSGDSEYAPQLVQESRDNWNSYSEAQQEAIKQEGNAIYAAIAKAIDAGEAEQDTVVQDLMQRWHDHLCYFYEPTMDVLRGLGDLYNSHPDFITNFRAIHPDLAPFMRNAINQYVDDLEDTAIRRLLAEDDADQSDSLNDNDADARSNRLSS